MDHGRLAVITGASGGIGLELARCAARDGYQVMLVSSEVTKLREAARKLRDAFEAQTEVVAANLATVDGVELVLQAIGDRPVDVLVNNAGFATWGRFDELRTSRELDEVRLNVEAVVHLTRALLPRMTKAGTGRILNVASTAAFMPGPLMSVYYATKSFVYSFSLGLAEELNGTGVTVTVLCPGPTQTGFVSRAHMEDSKLFRRRLMTAVRVAAEGWHGMKSGKRVVIPGWRNWLEAHAVRFIPHRLLTWTVLRAQEKR